MEEWRVVKYDGFPKDTGAFLVRLKEPRRKGDGKRPFRICWFTSDANNIWVDLILDQFYQPDDIFSYCKISYDGREPV